MNSLEKINELGLKCNTLLSDCYEWQNIDCYLELIEEFLNRKINGIEFETRFYEIRNSDCQKDGGWEELVYIIDNFKLKQFQGFSSLISKLFTDCDVFEPDPLLREDYEISEEELRNCVKKTLLEIKDRYP